MENVLRIMNFILEIVIALFVIFFVFGVWLLIAPFVITNFGLFVMFLPVLFSGVIAFAVFKNAQEQQLKKIQIAKRIVFAATLGFIGGLFADMFMASVFLGDSSLVVDLVQKQFESGIQFPIFESFYRTALQ